MPKSKILALVAVLSMTAGVMLSPAANAAAFSPGSAFHGDSASTGRIVLASAPVLDDNGDDATRPEASDDHDSGSGGNQDADDDSDAGGDHDSGDGSDHDSDSGGDD